jgi:hypothetical protein
MERQPKPSSVKSIDKYIFTAFPNPTKQKWNILSPKTQTLTLMNAQLQIVKMVNVVENELFEFDATIYNSNNFCFSLMEFVALQIYRLTRKQIII